MKRFNSLKKNQDFQTVYRGGKSYANKYLVMYVMDSGREDTRIGISASKKVGNSVVRHRFARLVRESFRLNKDILEERKRHHCCRTCDWQKTKISTRLRVLFCTYAGFITF